jgi:hypothetical protein
MRQSTAAEPTRRATLPPIFNRRQFLQLVGSAVVLGGVAGLSGNAARASAVGYGALGPPDANGLRLPRNFRSRLLAQSFRPVGPRLYPWHTAPDGGACFTAADGGWVYVSNSEAPAGGASALRFDRRGAVVDAYPILLGTSSNCSGGATPWGTWLSCEEKRDGRVWEADPFGRHVARVRPALGVFTHEAVAFADGAAFLTEDEPDGCLYRFVASGRGQVQRGVLEVAAGTPANIKWVRVPDPSAAVVPTRHQVPGAIKFNKAEGCFALGRSVVVCESGADRIWALEGERLTCRYDGALAPTAPLHGVDGITVHRNGVAFVAEDGGDMQVCGLFSGGVAPVAQFVGHDDSEVTGLAFDPSGRRLYLSSQRGSTALSVQGVGLGQTFEITGPF